jgi:hypothetical protein
MLWVDGERREKFGLLKTKTFSFNINKTKYFTSNTLISNVAQPGLDLRQKKSRQKFVGYMIIRIYDNQVNI